MRTQLRFLLYNAYGIGGTVKTVFNFANFLASQKGYNVKIISVRQTKDTPILKINDNVSITALQDVRRGAKYTDEELKLIATPSELICKDEDLYRMMNAYTDMRLIDVLSSFRNGVLITTTPSFNILSAKYVDDSVVKIGQEHKSFIDHSSGIQKLIKEYYTQLDAITILTNSNQRVYERRLQRQIPIYVLGNGTEMLPYRVNLKNHVIIAAGRYAEQKGYDMLIKSFALAVRTCPDWILKIYGDGRLTQEYVQLIQECCLEDKVILEPGSDKMNEKLSEASIHVCSSYYEPFGMVIIEGFAMGLPCISFACDGPREIITDGYNGIIVEKENVEALSSAMIELMINEELRIELGKNAYQTSHKYDINVVGDNLLKIIEKTIEEKKSRNKEKKGKNSKNKNIQIKDQDITPAEKNNVIKIQEIDYDKFTTLAREGRIGFKTIINMMKGWVLFKMIPKSEKTHSDRLIKERIDEYKGRKR